jgi:hypothetical protein
MSFISSPPSKGYTPPDPHPLKNPNYTSMLSGRESDIVLQSLVKVNIFYWFFHCFNFFLEISF